jgi:hypothetical protein
MKKSNLITGIAGLAVGLAVIYAYVYVAGKSWRKSQKTSDGGFLNADGGMYGLGCRTCQSTKNLGGGNYETTTYTSQTGYCRPDDVCITSIRPKKVASIM